YFVMAGSTMLVGVFQKHSAMARASLAEVVSRVVLVALTVALAMSGAGVAALLGALLVANVIWLVLTIRFAAPFVRIRPKADPAVWKRVLSRSWPIALSIIFNLMYLKGDILLIS